MKAWITALWRAARWPIGTFRMEGRRYWQVVGGNAIYVEAGWTPLKALRSAWNGHLGYY